MFNKKKNSQPRYVDAVDWIAQNDNPGDDDAAAEIAGYVTVIMVADLFNKSAEQVAREVLYRRGQGPGSVETHRQWLAFEKRNAADRRDV
jgi:hypothetical protein